MAALSVLFLLVLHLSACAARPNWQSDFVVLESDHDIDSWHSDGWKRLNRASGDQMTSVTFALKQRDPEQLERLFWQISDPSSADYGKYLTLQELALVVAPTDETVFVVRSWLHANGIDTSKCTVPVTQDFLTCKIRCDLAEKLLPGAEFYHFQHENFPRPVLRSSRHYSVPKEVAPFVDFVGGVLRFPYLGSRPFSTMVVEDFIGEPGGSLAHIGVYPSVLRERYNVSSTVGSHPNNSQCVAQFLEQFYNPGDLKEFFRLWGSSFTHLDEMSKVIGPDTGRSGIEASLDTQYIMSLGANISTWFWSTAGRHESQEPFLEWLVAISNHSTVPWVHSISYSDNEDTLSVDYMNRINAEFQKAGVRGLSFLFASGDNGAGCKKDKFRPMYPSSSPYVTTVGGTAFSNPFTISGEYAYEISGGGFSNVFPTASYQTDVVEKYLKSGPNLPPSSYYNPKGRGFPDIAALSNHFWIVNNLVPVAGVAGTSASTPTVAGIISLLNDARFHNNKPSMGFLNPFLYQQYEALYDVTTGCHEGCLAHDRGFCATTGWDPVTGHGSPNFPSLLKAALG